MPPLSSGLTQAAATALRDRPLVAKQLLEQGLKEATRDLAAVRQGDIVALARVYRDTLQQPEAERELLRRWLDDQRNHRLSATDAEGRVILAQQYDALLGERQTAVALLQDAWRIDPQSREVADAFRRTGAVYLVGDWTNRDAVIAQALAEQGRVGVPLYLMYGADGGAPKVLPQLLSAFEGWEIKGRPSVVAVRGQAMARDGKFTGKLGHGRLVPRSPSTH